MEENSGKCGMNVNGLFDDLVGNTIRLCCWLYFFFLPPFSPNETNELITIFYFYFFLPLLASI